MSRRVETADDLAENVELRDVRFLEIRGRREAKGAILPGEMKFSIELLRAIEPRKFSFRFKTSAINDQVDFFMDIVTIFGSEEDLDVNDSVINDFIEDVAMPVAMPYVRSEISRLAGELRVHALVNIWKPGRAKKTTYY